MLCTTDSATDTLAWHQQIRDSGWAGSVRPTFRPDLAINILHPDWPAEMDRLGRLTGGAIGDYRTYIAALESRRGFFREHGRDGHRSRGADALHAAPVRPRRRGDLRSRPRTGEATPADLAAFTGHMLMEMARMSVEDGLVMQLHPGSLRNHNRGRRHPLRPRSRLRHPASRPSTRRTCSRCSTPTATTRASASCSSRSTSRRYARELAPLAGHYPALRLGPPWWFHDSIEGMQRFRHAVTETAGFYNTAGFNDDTRAFPSIPARHDLCRRVDANFLAGLVARHVLELEEAHELIVDLSYGLAKATYRLP